MGLSSSAGISVSKLLAKLVSSEHKPNQQTVFLPTPDRLSQLLPDDALVQRLPGLAVSQSLARALMRIPNRTNAKATSDACAPPRKPRKRLTARAKARLQQSLVVERLEHLAFTQQTWGRFPAGELLSPAPRGNWGCTVHKSPSPGQTTPK